MSSNTSMYACPKCENPNTHVERRPDGFCYCPDCQHRWQIGKSQPKPSLFDRITASPAALAKELITTSYDEFKDCTVYWAWLGNGRREAYYSESEAIAATLKKLTEEVE